MMGVWKPESVTGMVNVPALSLTISLSLPKFTVVDNRWRSSRASNDALRWNAHEQLRRDPVRVRQRECRMAENHDARAIGDSFLHEIRPVVAQQSDT